MEQHFHHVYPDCSIAMALFSDVTNAKDLKQSVMKGEFEATLLNTQMVRYITNHKNDHIIGYYQRMLKYRYYGAYLDNLPANCRNFDRIVNGRI